MAEQKDKDKKSKKTKIVAGLILSTILVSSAIAGSISVITKTEAAKTQQDTIYIDKNGNQVTTSEHDLKDIESKEIIQIGFYQDEKKEEIVAARMPKTVKKVPNQLPPEITSLSHMFNRSNKFNQDISTWNTSNVKIMSLMFHGATSFDQNLSSWNVDKVTKFEEFASNSGIDNNDKLPKFKN